MVSPFHLSGTLDQVILGYASSSPGPVGCYDHECVTETGELIIKAQVRGEDLESETIILDPVYTVIAVHTPMNTRHIQPCIHITHL